MRAALGDDNHTRVGLGEFFSVPLQKSRRANPKIDGDVPDAPLETTHQLHLGMRSTLIVQPTHSADGMRSGMVDLHDTAWANEAFEIMFAIQPHKSTTVVAVWLCVDQHQAGYAGWGNFHAVTQEAHGERAALR